jgi:transcriptional regulator GlxA family with amidase domain
MFVWIRLLLADALLDDHKRTFESVARVTGFSSAAAAEFGV